VHNNHGSSALQFVSLLCFCIDAFAVYAVLLWLGLLLFSTFGNTKTLLQLAGRYLCRVEVKMFSKEKELQPGVKICMTGIRPRNNDKMPCFLLHSCERV
jgi:hypothetical protein